jgi:pimeloyl-ACP methyl ester carboxylesterase
MNSPADLVDIRSRESGEWELREAGRPNAGPPVLLLPGGLCSAALYDDLLAYAALDELPVRLVAATPPGFAGRPAPTDLSIESYARLASELAARLDCRAVVGHSVGANIALEMAASGGFGGPVVLLSPSLSREDEFKELAVLDRIGRLPGIGALVWAMVPRMSARVLRSNLPPARRDLLLAELRRNQGQVCRRMVRRYFEYLDHGAPLVGRLCDAGVRALVVFGDHEEVGLTADEQNALDACPRIAVEVVAGATHFLVTEEPRRIAKLILQGTADAVSVG